MGPETFFPKRFQCGVVPYALFSSSSSTFNRLSQWTSHSAWLWHPKAHKGFAPSQTHTASHPLALGGVPVEKHNLVVWREELHFTPKKTPSPPGQEAGQLCVQRAHRCHRKTARLAELPSESQTGLHAEPAEGGRGGDPGEQSVMSSEW